MRLPRIARGAAHGFRGLLTASLARLGGAFKLSASHSGAILTKSLADEPGVLLSVPDRRLHTRSSPLRISDECHQRVRDLVDDLPP
jgi:hypothetical protein